MSFTVKGLMVVSKLCKNNNTAQKKMKFSKLRIWSRLLKKSFMENFLFCSV